MKPCRTEWLAKIQYRPGLPDGTGSRLDRGGGVEGVSGLPLSIRGDGLSIVGVEISRFLVDLEGRTLGEVDLRSTALTL